MNTRRLAIFDLDGTLLRRDSFLPFLFRSGVRHRRWRAMIGAPVWIGAYACGLTSDHNAKERLLRSFFRGASRETITASAADFCERWVSRQLNGPVVERLRTHQQEGDRVVLLSASPSVSVEPIAAWLSIDEVVCTQVEFSGGLCTGRIEHENCKGEAKLTALKTYLQQSEAPADSFAYGDSTHDLPVLRWVEHGFLVRRGELDPVDSLRERKAQLAPS